jgi:hypothetical protein
VRQLSVGVLYVALFRWADVSAGGGMNGTVGGRSRTQARRTAVGRI